IHDHNGGKGGGTITYNEGFVRSSNVASSKLLWENMDSDTYLEYLHAFDFNKKTGIDLTGKAVGTISYTYNKDKLTTTFRQSTTLTPIQQVKDENAITNDGEMLKLYVIKKVVYSSGEIVEEKSPEVVGKPISEETAHQVLNL